MSESKPRARYTLDSSWRRSDWSRVVRWRPSGGGLEHAAAHAKLTGDRCTAHGVVPACARERRGLSLRQGQSILRS